MAPLADVVVLAPDKPLFAAAVELMQSQAGRGVVAGGRLVGLLTVKDLSRLLEIEPPRRRPARRAASTAAR